ncbi:Hypothetical protein CHV_a0222 [Cardinium endosymbiont cBtQ1 of Bemisia tabaci]|uniref:hypothetical protein n=1 Tax=Cardinium endosymbiont of Bemisia tabaci TaxID=672794 RepID=UPI000442D0D3|nr:hypothetical protein [Cardinium endosymbiont of Bemisia tabaci]CDG49541.1 Hypothetical protein CHV_a0222 [Cardinium endosymbiont cBtQ1 of Bemisia tabaci]
MIALFGLIFTNSSFLKKEEFNNKNMHTKIKDRVRKNISNLLAIKKPSKTKALY